MILHGNNHPTNVRLFNRQSAGLSRAREDDSLTIGCDSEDDDGEDGLRDTQA